MRQRQAEKRDSSHQDSRSQAKKGCHQKIFLTPNDLDKCKTAANFKKFIMDS